jgi:hydrogenase maturation protein HypF
MIASLTDFERFGHLAYYLLAGADAASKEAIRPILGLLNKTYGEDFDIEEFRWLLEPIEPDTDRQNIVLEQIEKQVNTVDSSSLGRVFDAVAALVGLGSYNHFDAQLPMALEAIIEREVEESYGFDLLSSNGEPVQLDLRKMIGQLIEDIRGRVDRGVVSAKFHNCIADALLAMAHKAREKTSLDTVALSGGVFCNRYLANRLIRLLKKSDFRVLFNREVPSNDGGIALGQAAIAAALLRRNR